MNQIMRGEPLTVFGDGTQTRAFSHIDDVAPHIARSVHVADAYNQVFNIGADRPYSINELVEVIANAFGVTPDVRYLPARNEVLHAFCDHDKAKRVFGVNGSIGLAEGIGRMAEWAQTVGARSSREFEDIEVRRNLPQIWNGER